MNTPNTFEVTDNDLVLLINLLKADINKLTQTQTTPEKQPLLQQRIQKRHTLINKFTNELNTRLEI